MSDYENFEPRSAEEDEWVENFNLFADLNSEKLKNTADNDRVDVFEKLEFK